MFWNTKVLCVCIFIISISCKLLAQPRVEVAHWWTSKSEAKAVEVIIKAFEKKGYQWIDSAIEGGGGDALINTLKARLTAGNPPVAVQMFMGPNVWRWGEEGALQSLDAIAQAGGWQKVLPPLINRMVQYEDQYVAVPINAHRVNWMWINSDVFRQARAKVPTTWSEFFEAAEKIQSKGFIPVALGGQPWQEATLFESVLLGVGGVKFHRAAMIELKQDALTSPTMVKVFETMRRIKKYTDKDAPGRTWDEATEMVMGGRAAIQFMGDWAKGEFLAAGKQPGIDFLCLPSPETSSVFLIDTDTFAMFKVKDKESQRAQKELAKIVMDPEVQKQFNLIKGSIPARMDISRSGFDICACAAMDTFIAAASQDSIVPAFSYAQANSPDVQKVMVNLIHTHFTSNMPAEEAAKKLAAVVKATRQ